MLEKSFFNIITKENMLKNNETIIIATSGGVDSSVLVHLLKKFSVSRNIKIILAHLNHGFRGKEALRDQRFVENLAKKLNLIFISKKIDMPKIIKKQKEASKQNLARLERIKFFKEVALQSKTKKIFLAHHLDDVIETFIFRLLRGSGLEGFKTIEYKNKIDNLVFYHPLIDFTKDELKEYAKKNKIKYIFDSSNKSTKYKRNFIRLRLIPYIQKYINPNIVKTLFNTVKILKDDFYLLEKLANIKQKKLIIKQNKRQIFLDKLKFIKLPTSLKRIILRKAIEQIKGNLIDITFTHIEDILKIINKTKEQKIICLPKNIYVKKDKEFIIIEKRKGN